MFLSFVRYTKKPAFKLSFLLGFSALCASSVTLKSVSGVSYYDVTNQKIYAGAAGICAAPVAGSTCNTCTDTSGGGMKACNQNSIHNALVVGFTFASTSDLSGKQIALFVDNGSSKIELSGTRATLSSAAASTDISISTTWGNYCSALGYSSCQISSGDLTLSNSFYIGADENGTGGIDLSNELTAVSTQLHSISQSNSTLNNQSFCPGTGDISGNLGMCFYSLFSGDQKLIVLGDPPPRAQSTPPTNSPAFDAVVFFPFLTPSGFPPNMSNGNAAPVVKAIVSATDFSLTGDPYIGGLKNYERYCVIAGQRNLAGNIFGFVTTSVNQQDACVSPSAVAGLLNDHHCFISTAAFGSNMASEVQLLRNFRDQFLLDNYLGAEFTKFYYQYGPRAANFIAESESLRAAVRGALYPAIGFAWLALHYGIYPALFMLALGLVLLFRFRSYLGVALKGKIRRV